MGRVENLNTWNHLFCFPHSQTQQKHQQRVQEKKIKVKIKTRPIQMLKSKELTRWLPNAVSPVTQNTKSFICCIYLLCNCCWRGLIGWHDKLHSDTAGTVLFPANNCIMLCYIWRSSQPHSMHHFMPPSPFNTNVCSEWKCSPTFTWGAIQGIQNLTGDEHNYVGT